MGLFRKQKKTFDDIVSVVLLEQTQLFKNQTSWGLSFGDNPFGDPIAMSQSVPAGTELKFSVTYRDGTKKIVKASAGSNTADRLLQMALDPGSNPAVLSNTSNGNSGTDSREQEEELKKQLIDLQKKQLPHGTYMIGTDIPPGTYDFTWVYGSGTLELYKSAGDTTFGNLLHSANIGNSFDYEDLQCFHLKCEEGQMLLIRHNLIVEIARSKKIELDL